MKTTTPATVPFVQWLLENFPPHVNTAKIPPDKLRLELRCIYHLVSDMVWDLNDQAISLNSSEYELLHRLRDFVHGEHEAIEALKYAVKLYRRDYTSEHHTPIPADNRIRIADYPSNYDPDNVEGLDAWDTEDYKDDSAYFLNVGPCEHPLSFRKREFARDYIGNRKHNMYRCDRCRRYVVV